MIMVGAAATVAAIVILMVVDVDAVFTVAVTIKNEGIILQSSMSSAASYC